jgi:hypothetical protein
MANQFIKLAGITPMHKLSRDIIQMKLVNPGITMTGLSLAFRMRAEDILAYEKEGLNRIAQYIKSTSIQESTNKFNRDVKEAEAKNLNKQGDSNSLLNAAEPST